MTTKKKFLKITIIFILVFFVAVTWLSMIVPYIGGNKNTQGTWDITSWAIIESWVTDTVVDTTVDTGATQLPELTKEEASKKLQETLSGLNNKPAN